MTSRKALFGAVMSLIFSASLCSAFPLRVLEPGLPNDTAFRMALEHLGSEIELVDTWHSEWNFATPKEQVVKEIGELLSNANSFVRRGESGPDIRLFQALLKHYLYNLEALHNQEEIVTDLEALKKQFPKDYRPGWLLAGC